MIFFNLPVSGSLPLSPMVFFRFCRLFNLSWLNLRVGPCLLVTSHSAIAWAGACSCKLSVINMRMISDFLRTFCKLAFASSFSVLKGKMILKH